MRLTHFQRLSFRPKVSLASLFIALATALVLTAPAQAFIGDVVISVDPGTPSAGQEFLAQVTGISTPTASVIGVELDGNAVKIQIDDTCFGLCPAEPFSFDVPIAPLDAGTYDLEITNVFGTTVASATVEVEEMAFAGLFIRMHFNASTDNDLLRVLVTAHTCLAMDLDSTSVNGDQIEIRGRIADGVCSASVGLTSAFSADVGPLEAGTYDVTLLLEDEGDPDAGYQMAAVDQAQVGDAPDAAALRNERFEVRVDWQDAAGETGVGRPVPGASNSTSLFSFFGRDNWELMVKVLDGCGLNDHYWVFTAGSTNVEYTIEVTDTNTGDVRTYTNVLGERAPAVTDVEAFATCSD